MVIEERTQACMQTEHDDSERPKRNDASVVKVEGERAAETASIIAKAAHFKQAGNDAWKQGNTKEALKQWHYSLLYSAGINSFAVMLGSRSRSTVAENRRAEQLYAAVQNNLAAAYLSQAKWEKVLHATEKALRVDPKNVRALYRSAVALLRLGNLQHAAVMLDRALELAPQDPAIRVLGREIVVEVEKIDAVKKAGEPVGAVVADTEDGHTPIQCSSP